MNCGENKLCLSLQGLDVSSLGPRGNDVCTKPVLLVDQVRAAEEARQHVENETLIMSLLRRQHKCIISQ